MQFAEKTVLVIGAARSGIAAAQYLKAQGCRVYLNDLKKKEDLEPKILNHLEAQGIDLILGQHPRVEEINPQWLIVSPGVPLDAPPLRAAAALGVPIWGELEFAARLSKAPMVVITGTNGKTTTTALTGQIFLDAGKNVFVGGNIGVPFVGEAARLKPQDVAVLEASSFQLEVTVSFKPRVAVILNLSPDHIDRHGSFAAYIKAKAKIFAQQDQEDWLVLNGDDEETKKLAQEAQAKVIFFSRKHILKEGFCVENGYLTAKMSGHSTPIIKAEDIGIKGAHNLENALAAVAAGWLMGVKPESLALSLKTFPGVPHRLEFVLEHQGVTYINDSKGTNIDAAIKALEAYPNPIILIAGGKGKGASYAPFAAKIKERVKQLITVGKDGPEIERAVWQIDYRASEPAVDFREAVKKASAHAQPGDIVLLSPACASFDMFSDFEERGEVFKALVKELAETGDLS